MRFNFIAAAMALALVPLSALATVIPAQPPFQPTPSYSQLSVSATSARVALPTGSTIVVYNTGSVAAYVTLGGSTVTATTGNDVIQPSSWSAFTVGTNTYLAAITSSSTTALNISGGTGLPTGAGGGGGGGSSGNVNLNQVGGSSLSLGQQTAANSLPVILPSATITALTPLTTITANAGTNLNTSLLALETGGNLATIATNTAITNAGTSASKASPIQGVTGGVAVPVSGTFWQTTQPVSLASLPALTAGSATIGAVNIASGQTISLSSALPAGANAIGSVSVSNFPGTQPVSGTVTANAGTNMSTASLALETGGNLASVAANTARTNAGTSATTAGPIQGVTGGVAVPVSGTFWQVTQPVSLASLPALATGANTIGAVNIASGQTIGVSSLPSLPGFSATPSFKLQDGSGNLIGSTGGALNVSGSFSGSIAGFDPVTIGTPITATTSGVTGTLPSGTAVEVVNVGANSAWCQLGASATGITNAKQLSPGQQWAIAVGSATQITCESMAATTTINLIGGSGLGVDTAGTGSVSSSVTVSNFPATQAISASSLPLPSGAATAAGLTTINTTLGSPMQQTGGTVTTNAGTNTSTAALALESGGNLATVATNTALTNAGTSATKAAPVQGVTGGVAVPVSGTFWQTTQPVSLASLPALAAGANAIGSVSVSNFPGTQPVSGTVTANAGTGTMAVSAASLPLPSGAASAANQTAVTGSVSGGAAAASSLASGGLYNSTLPTLTTGQQAAEQLDSNGRQIMVGAGVAGTPAGGVASIQGVSGGTALPVSGTFWQTTQPVSLASLPALTAGSATIGAVNIASGQTIGVSSLPALAAGANAIGSVSVSNFPGTQTVSGTVTANAGSGTMAVSVASLPLPSGAATAANQPTNSAIGATTSGQTGHLVFGAASTALPTATTADSWPLSIVPASGGVRNDLSSFGGTVVSLGQQTAANSIPVVLPSATITTLTPPTTITANAGSGTFAVSAASLPLPASASTAANQTNVQSSPGTSALTALTVQGSASGVAMPIAGSVSITGTPTVAGTGTFTTSSADTTPASQTITVADTGSTSATWANGQAVITGTPTASSSASFGFNGAQTLTVEVTGTATGEVETDVSQDGGTTWIKRGVTQLGAAPAGNYSTFGGTGITPNFLGVVNVSGFSNLRVRALSAATWSGTATVSVRDAPMTIGAVHVAGAPFEGATGSAGPTDAVQMGALVGGNLTAMSGTANGLKVDESAVTQPVSLASLPALAAGANAIGSVSVSNFPGTQPVSLASLPALAAGSATVGKVDLLGNGGTALDSAAGTPNSQAVTVQGNSSSVPLPVQFSAAANGGTPNNNIVYFSGLTQVGSAAHHQIYRFQCDNTASSTAASVAVYDVASTGAVTLGSSPYPIFHLGVPAGQSQGFAMPAVGIGITNGIVMVATTAYGGTTVVSTGLPCDINFF
jgi:hypothetical protein